MSLLNFFKVFFPSWSFFNQSAKIPLLQFRHHNSNEWQVLFYKSKRKIIHFFLNPEVNYYYACQSHLERWLIELQNSPSNDDVTSSQNYLITTQMAAYELKRQSRYLPFYFRLVLVCPQTQKTEVVLTSKVHV